MKSSRPSRLRRHHEKQSRRQAVLYLGLSFLFIVLMIKFGIPAFIRVLDLITNRPRNSIQSPASQGIPPQPPVLSPLPEATFSAQIKVTGLSQPETSVTLKVNDSEVGSQKADQNGKFTFNTVPLKDGSNHIVVWAQIDGGAGSQQTTVDVVFDNKPPKLDITDPKDEATFFGPTQKTITIKGTVDDSQAQLKINNNFVSIDSNGQFSYRIQLKEGMNEFNVVATDTAGNQTTKLLRVTYSL